ncbi:MAG: hypothetical protein ACHQVS_00900 [Candidatus Babeliales bacterium]
MIKKIQYMLVIAVALSGIPVHAADASLMSNVWKNKAIITVGIAGLVLSILALLYAKKHRGGQPVGNASSARPAAPASDAAGQGAVEKAVESANVRTQLQQLQGNFAAIVGDVRGLQQDHATMRQTTGQLAQKQEEISQLMQKEREKPLVSTAVDLAPVNGEIAQLHEQVKKLQEQLAEKPSRNAFDQLNGEIAKRPTDATLRKRDQDFVTKAGLQPLSEQVVAIQHQIASIDALYKLCFLREDAQQHASEISSLKEQLTHLQTKLGSTLTELSERVDKLAIIRKANRSLDEFNAQQVAFGPDTVKVMSPLPSPKARRDGTGASVDVSVEPAAAEEPVAVVVTTA